MKRLLVISILLTVCFTVMNAQSRRYGALNDPVYRAHVSKYRNFKQRPMQQYNNQPQQVINANQVIINQGPQLTDGSLQMPTSTTLQPQLLQQNNQLINELNQRIASLEQQQTLNAAYPKWMMRKSSGDCLKKSGRFNYAAIGTAIVGAAGTGICIYAMCDQEDPAKKDKYKYAAIGIGGVTVLTSFILHMNAIKWKIRAGKKHDMEMKLQGNGLALNF